MKTDRELLELAAKAAGHVINQRRQASRDAMCDPEKSSLWIDRVSTGWNPILDDGQAMRLAVRLNLFEHDRDTDITLFGAHFDTTDTDPYAATRRAIVLASAAIGEAMP